MSLLAKASEPAAHSHGHSTRPDAGSGAVSAGLLTLDLKLKCMLLQDMRCGTAAPMQTSLEMSVEATEVKQCDIADMWIMWSLINMQTCKPKYAPPCGSAMASDWCRS